VWRCGSLGDGVFGPVAKRVQLETTTCLKVLKGNKKGPPMKGRKHRSGMVWCGCRDMHSAEMGSYVVK